MLFSCGIAWVAGPWIAPATVPSSLAAGIRWEWLAYGLLVGGAGMVGDLAESLLKRDVGQRIPAPGCPASAACWTSWTPCCWPLRWPGPFSSRPRRTVIRSKSGPLMPLM